MGLREFLTKPIRFGAASFSWKEPTLYKIRLRGDFWLRVAVVIGAWGAGTGILWVLFANNIHRPGLALGAGIGSICGLVAALLVFFLRDHVSGRVSVEDKGIRRFRTYGGFTPESWAEWQEWPFASIGRCAIIHAATLGKSFSVLLLAVGEEREIVGLPQSVDVVKLTKHLVHKGVTVTQAKGIPPQFTLRLHNVVAFFVSGAGLLTMVGGLTFFIWARGDAAGARPQWPEVDHAPLNTAERDRQWNFADQQVDLASDQADDPEPAGQIGFGGAVSDSSLDTPKPTAGQPRETEVVGAEGGFAFSRVGTDSKHVVGFRSNFGQWAGKQWVSRFEPLYGGEPAFPGWQVVTARPGYAVGGLILDTPEFVNAYSVVFMRIKSDGALDVEDTYSSDWIGPKSASPPRTLAGNGDKVIGIYGRAGAILNAVGLVLADN